MLRTTRVRVSLHLAVGCPSLLPHREANRTCTEAFDRQRLLLTVFERKEMPASLKRTPESVLSPMNRKKIELEHSSKLLGDKCNAASR